ncbi:MAG: hypothetical protein AUH85_09250 [Chloroflexi bacterium 13_1_40CM_4_68_4]|nr:MAG: hypothetical protein AUH85_09250 [Chloroflexi bacterium 13_1_40CM_4_68_4]
MFTLFQKTVLGVLAGGFVVLALVVSAKGSFASTGAIGSGGPLTLVTQGNQGGPPPGIVVVGEAKLDYRPDVAYLTLGAVAQAPTAQAAMDDLSRHIATMLQRAQGSGIADRDVAHANYTIQPQYSYSQNQPPKLSGYQATQQVVVTLRDVSAVGKTLDALLKDDAATTASVRFSLASGKDPELDARARAIADARSKAEAMANAAGVRLGAAVSITEVAGASNYSGNERFAPAAAPMPQVPTGDVQTTIRMQVQFAIGG